jgi:hypothetical protein
VSFVEGRSKSDFIGFGSMRTGDARCLVGIVKDVVQRMGLHVVLQRGWEGLQSDGAHAGIHVVGSMPDDWLFS